jgi:hypothetical protein
MTELKKLPPGELSRIAANPPAAVLSVAGSAGSKTAMPGSRGIDASAPKKRRKKSAAWKTMIAVTDQSRRGKGR